MTTAEATITIKDVNDEAPRFNQRDYYVEIPENLQDNTPLPRLDMSVVDPDVVSERCALLLPGPEMTLLFFPGK